MSQSRFAALMPWVLLLLIGAASIGGAFAAAWFDEGPTPHKTPEGKHVSAPAAHISYIR